MLKQILRLSLPVYVMMVVGVGFVFTTSNALTKQEGHLTFFSEVYSILLYLTSIGALVWIELCAIGRLKDDPEVTENGKTAYRVTGVKESAETATSKIRYRKKGVNFYFLIGGFAFALGAVIHDVLFLVDFGTHGEKSCLHPVDIVTSIIRALFVIVTLAFICRQHRVTINMDTLGIRFLFAHVISTNICLWINSSVYEAAESFRHDEEERRRDEGLAPNSTESCYSNRELRTLSSPYLTPCRIEFTLFAIAVLYQILARIEDHTGDDLEEEVKATTSDEGRHVKWLRVFKTLHVGSFLFVMTIIAVVLFFNYADFVQDTETAQLIFYGTEITLLLILIASVMVGFFCLKELCFLPKNGSSLDENLLIIAMSGQILYDVSRLIASVGSVTSGQSASAFPMVAAILSLVELSLQTVFILFGSHLCSDNDHHEEKKPGRAAIGFVLLGNLSMWLLITFEAKKTIMVPLYTDFYGFLPWALISFTLTPMLIFYRFHSTVVLSDIWKEAYEKQKSH